MFVVIWLLMTCPIDTCPGAAGRVIENDNWITWTVETALVHSAATYCIHHHHHHQLLWNCLSFRIIDYWLPPGSRAHNTLTVALSVYHRISEFVNIQEKYKVLITSTGTVACFNPVEKREARLAAWKHHCGAECSCTIGQQIVFLKFDIDADWKHKICWMCHEKAYKWFHTLQTCQNAILSFLVESL